MMVASVPEGYYVLGDGADELVIAGWGAAAVALALFDAEGLVGGAGVSLALHKQFDMGAFEVRIGGLSFVGLGDLSYFVFVGEILKAVRG